MTEATDVGVTTVNSSFFCFETSSFIKISKDTKWIKLRSKEFNTSVQNYSKKVPKISIDTVDNYCQTKSIKFIDILKIDTQGYEEKVLEGAKNTLRKNEIKVEDASISKLIESYTREAGVRNLERQLANICRKTARDIATKVKKKVIVTPEVVHDYLGPEIFFSDEAERANKPGVVVGLAWTAFGGDILFIEACKMPGKGVLKLTGKLGDVMKESAQAAFSYVRTNAKKFGIDENFYKKHESHI